MDNKRTNAGYEIIKSIKLFDDQEYVLGLKVKNNEEEYVTWYYNHGTYYWGHYFMNKKDAYLDIIGRAIDFLESERFMLNSIGGGENNEN